MKVELDILENLTYLVVLKKEVVRNYFHDDYLIT
jgi:hypothetical protein